MIVTRYFPAARACQVRDYVRHHAALVGAPVRVAHDLAEIAVHDLTLGASAWRAIRHAMAELDRRADAAGWWGGSV